jgi:phenylacetate-CoA ligase
MDLSVIVPCFNEQANLDALVARVGAALAGLEFELVLVDDGSHDGSWEAMTRLASAHPFVALLRHATNRGVVAGWRSGVAHARGELVCVLDADLQYRPEDIPRLYQDYRCGGVDIVQGARRWEGDRHSPRYLISRGLNLLLNGAFAMDLDDNKSGFFVCRRQVLEDLLGYKKRYHAWQNLIMVAAHARGHSLRALPVAFDKRHAGRSFLPTIPIVHSFRSLIDVVLALDEYRLRGGNRR